ncbi:MAG TPA: LysR substrate-binding domain-containing protein [Bauldia sp.]|nr:LysR substrate-binding domain-containing protein [Bauldia sp.]
MAKVTRRLQLRDFQLILAIHESGQLALAADQLSITQPAASRLLSEIEHALGSLLFRRHPKGMTATAVGEIVARNARNLLNGVDQTLRDVDAVVSGRGGAARVGAVTGGAVAFVVPAIQQLQRLAAGADIHIEVAPSETLVAGLRRGDYDFVLARVPADSDPREFAILPGRVEVIHFLVRQGHPLAGRETLSLADLAGYEWVIQAHGTPMRHAVEEAFVAQGVSLPAELVNSTSLLVTIAFLASSNAIAPVPREVTELLGDNGIGGKLAALDLRESIVVNPYYLITRKNQVISPLAARLRELVFAAMSADKDQLARPINSPEPA